ncbi:MAG TPA: hypothetical protein PKW98_14765 [Candidatus Wallbacteria bacterium]|nr:MAG: hypothetical protein BWY32_03547 [bacterium ADurb.Bin243]HPG59080.1 hypothetical protein [Candidatus Wallbacteria bacterium]
MMKMFAISWMIRELVSMALAEALVLAAIIELAELGMQVLGLS